MNIQLLLDLSLNLVAEGIDVTFKKENGELRAYPAYGFYRADRTSYLFCAGENVIFSRETKTIERVDSLEDLVRISYEMYLRARDEWNIRKVPSENWSRLYKQFNMASKS